MEKDKQREYNKEYYEKTREKRRAKIECECGASVCREYLGKHRMTKIHIKRMGSNEMLLKE
jgi:hypothetical protein